MTENQETADIQVSYTDQLQINEFARLNDKLGLIEARLGKLRQDLEWTEDVLSELELRELEVDEDEDMDYKLGDVFVKLPLSEIKQKLELEKEQTSKLIEQSEQQSSGITNRMKELKVALYAKFGSSINLEK